MTTSLTRLAVQPRPARYHSGLDTIGFHLFPRAAPRYPMTYDFLTLLPFRLRLSLFCPITADRVLLALSHVGIDNVNLNCTHVYSSTYADSLHTLAQTKPSTSTKRALAFHANKRGFSQVRLILTETTLPFILAVLFEEESVLVWVLFSRAGKRA